MNKADTLIAEGHGDKAQTELRNALQKSPDNAEANYKLAQLEEEAGDIGGAIPHFFRAARPEARLLAAQLKVADILIDMNRLPDAYGRINNTLGAFPDNAAALAIRADAAQRMGQSAQAKADADAVLQRDADNTRALAVLAQQKLQAKDTAGAIALVDRGLAKHPDDLRLLQVQAAVALSASDPTKAIDAFRSIVRAVPNNVQARSALARVEADNGHYTEALASLEDGVKADPTNSAMQMALVNFLASQKKSDEVVAYLNGLIRQYPDEASYVLVLAEFYRSSGDPARSRAVLDAAVARLGTSKAGLQVKIAVAKLDSNAQRYAEAEQTLQDVLAADPENAEARMTRALIALKNNQADAAVADLLAVLRTDPANEPAYSALATAYTLKGDQRSAVDAMRRAVAVRPGDDRAEIRLAAFLQEEGDGAGAKELMSRVTLRRPQSPIVWFTDGELAAQRSDWSGSARSLRRLQDLPNSSLLATQLKAELSSAQGNPGAAVPDFEAIIDHVPDVPPATIAQLARAGTASHQAAAVAQYLTHRAPDLTGAAQPAAWTAAMRLQLSGGNFAEAAAAFGAAIKGAPTNIAIYSDYVEGLIAVRRLKDAQQAVLAGQEAGAPKWGLSVLSGRIDAAAGDQAAALADYKAAVAENPLSVDAANNYATVLADHDPKNIEALTAARERLGSQESTKNPSLLDTMAWLDYRLGRLDEAKLILTRINAQESRDPQVRLHLAAVLLATGERARGLALLDTVKGLQFPGSDEIQALSAT